MSCSWGINGQHPRIHASLFVLCDRLQVTNVRIVQGQAASPQAAPLPLPAPASLSPPTSRAASWAQARPRANLTGNTMGEQYQSCLAQQAAEDLQSRHTPLRARLWTSRVSQLAAVSGQMSRRTPAQHGPHRGPHLLGPLLAHCSSLRQSQAQAEPGLMCSIHLPRRCIVQRGRPSGPAEQASQAFTRLLEG